MTPSPPREGCGAALGVLLILAGVLGFAVTFGGTAALDALAGAIPFAARWWPLGLVAYGALRLSGRLGSGRPGRLEVPLLVLFLGCGAALSAANFVAGGDFGAIRRWIEPFAGQPHREEIAAPVPADASTLKVDLPWGGALVRPAAGPDLRLILEGRSWGPASWPELAPIAADGTVSVRVAAPDDGEAGFHLTVEAPVHLQVDVTTGEGGVRVEGPFPEVVARGGAGPVTISGTRGAVRAESAGDSIRVRDVQGPVQVRGDDAAIDVGAVVGTVGVRAADSSVRLADVRGEARVETLDAPVRVQDHAGPLRIRAFDAHVTVTGVTGDAVIEGSGDLLASGVAGALEISFGDGPVVVEDAGGRVRVIGDPDLVRAARIAGPLEVRAPGGPVFASELALGASIRGGEVEVDLRALRGPLDLHAEEGDVRLALPGDARFRLVADPLPEGGPPAGAGEGGPEVELRAPEGAVRIRSRER